MTPLSRPRRPPMTAPWPIRYAAYLQSATWKVKREAVLKRADLRCEVCGQAGRLEVHHLTYARVFAEDLTDLQAVCAACHQLADLARQSRTDDARRGRRRRKPETVW